MVAALVIAVGLALLSLLTLQHRAQAGQTGAQVRQAFRSGQVRSGQVKSGRNDIGTEKVTERVLRGNKR